ncbi:hypothetical protein KUTeg_003682 [Tegillarca granosa]|uniref:Uncharacterized protein n=1 Tax=Tegillarca granosa TaxID=220873 RepID=A0ABQ9FMU4_TEGGR|nr:hypothetical protein KUTeg_003682 [Tegillarca granosa]
MTFRRSEIDRMGNGLSFVHSMKYDKQSTGRRGLKRKLEDDLDSSGRDTPPPSPDISQNSDVLHTPKRKRIQSTSKYIYQTLFLDGKNSDVSVVALGKEGLIQQCEGMIRETISSETVCCYHRAGVTYGLETVRKDCFDWLLLNILTTRNVDVLKDISVDLMKKLISTSNLYVMQVETDVYTMLKKWVFLQLHQNWCGTSTDLVHNSDEYFKQKLCNWIRPLFERQWKAMIQLEQGLDKGLDVATIDSNGKPKIVTSSGLTRICLDVNEEVSIMTLNNKFIFPLHISFNVLVMTPEDLNVDISQMILQRANKYSKKEHSTQTEQCESHDESDDKTEQCASHDGSHYHTGQCTLHDEVSHEHKEQWDRCTEEGNLSLGSSEFISGNISDSSSATASLPQTLLTQIAFLNLDIMKLKNNTTCDKHTYNRFINIP